MSTIKETLAHYAKLAHEDGLRFEEKKKDWPATKPCRTHPDCPLPMDNDASWRARAAVYAPCPLCDQDILLRRAGAPSNMLHATIDNWIAEGETGRRQLEVVRSFASSRKGFLVLLGKVGTGKTHLAVGVMRAFKRPVLYRQNGFLRALRATYSDQNLPDPVEVCQGADLFVLDEIGVSGGGRDEYPALHEILDHRHGEYKPTIITGNCDLDQLRSILGERLTDRIRQAAVAVVTLAGKSHRAGLQEKYLQGSAVEPPDEDLGWL